MFCRVFPVVRRKSHFLSLNSPPVMFSVILCLSCGLPEPPPPKVGAPPGPGRPWGRRCSGSRFRTTPRGLGRGHRGERGPGPTGAAAGLPGPTGLPAQPFAPAEFKGAPVPGQVAQHVVRKRRPCASQDRARPAHRTEARFQRRPSLRHFLPGESRAREGDESQD